MPEDAEHPGAATSSLAWMGSPEETSSRNSPSAGTHAITSELYEYCSKAAPFISASF